MAPYAISPHTFPEYLLAPGSLWGLRRHKSVLPVRIAGAGGTRAVANGHKVASTSQMRYLVVLEARRLVWVSWVPVSAGLQSFPEALEESVSSGLWTLQRAWLWPLRPT